MVDNVDDSHQQAAGDPRAGQRLANARRANNISMRDIAKELHLDEVRVQALEDNRFEELGAPVFAKGYLRKYAELVSVPVDDVLADYYRLNRAVGAPPVVGPKRHKPPADLSPGLWIGAIVILLAASATGYWWLSRPPTPSDVTVSRSAPPLDAEALSGQSVQPAEDGTVTILPPGSADADPLSTVVTDAAPAEAESSTALSPGAQAPAESDPSAGSTGVAEVQLQLSFSGDCWTEVTDANGRRLYFGLGTDGRNVTVSGVPPLRVLLGDNDSVSLLVNGQVYTVQANELRGNTARLTIAGS